MNPELPWGKSYKQQLEEAQDEEEYKDLLRDLRLVYWLSWINWIFLFIMPFSMTNLQKQESLQARETWQGAPDPCLRQAWQVSNQLIIIHISTGNVKTRPLTNILNIGWCTVCASLTRARFHFYQRYFRFSIFVYKSSVKKWDADFRSKIYRNLALGDEKQAVAYISFKCGWVKKI